MSKRILHLSLKKPQFEVTISGEKKSEFRKPSKWILSRIIGKEYDFIKFTNGYGNHRPSFLCEFKGWRYAESNNHKYSNGLVVNTDNSYIEILLGIISDMRNIENE